MFALVNAGCNRDGIKVYDVETNNIAAATPPPTAASPPPMPAGLPAPDKSDLPALKYAVPAGWQEKAPSAMRVASFDVSENGQTADISVIPLPAGEDELAIVNMWRDQMQLSALTNAPAPEMVSVGNDSAKLFDIASEQPLIDGKFRARILVAELTRGNTSWFFKMTGESEFVAAQKEKFRQFLKSISFVENAAPQNVSTPMANTPENQNANPNVNSIWTIPPDWKSQPPSEFLLAEFSIQTNGATAEVNVAELNGDGGGLEANVNRWRGQLGLQPIGELLTTPLSSTDTSGAQVVDFTGTDSKTGKPARLVGAIVPQNGETWFYKLMGDPQIVAAQKNRFIQFIQSANYANAH